MRPDFDIVAENKPVTEILRKSLISLRLTDESGTISDEAEIHIDYGSSALELKGELKIFLGYKEIGLSLMGVYTASEITVQWESRPAEFHHQSLAELCMNLSTHTAPIIQPFNPIPNVQW